MPFAAESANTYSTEAHEEARRAENKRKTEALEKIVKENFRPTIDDFSSSPIHRRFIRKDKEYVARNQRNFEYSKSADDQYHPKAIEYLVQFSINNGNLFYDEDVYEEIVEWSPRMLGACYSLWNDNYEHDDEGIYDRFSEPINVISEKLWNRE